MTGKAGDGDAIMLHDGGGGLVMAGCWVSDGWWFVGQRDQNIVQRPRHHTVMPIE